MITRTVGELHAHPKNASIYGDSADRDLVESVREKGVINPLLITYDNRVINGHRRLDAARKSGLDAVPVVVFQSHDELDILEALIESNRQRQKTNEQIGREYAELKEIYQERSRQGWRRNNDTVTTSVNQLTEAPPTRQAAQSLGVSHETARRAEQVVTVIDQLSDNGRKHEAEVLRKTLNANVRRAFETAQERGLIEKRPNAPPPVSDYITLEQWNTMDEGAQTRALQLSGAQVKMNAQDGTDNIEWAKWSWNPVTGCLHNCDYCYARDIAMRFYPQKFVPSIVPARLSAPSNTKLPADAQHDIGYKNVFVCSMADLFGKWVPAEWINAVLRQVTDNPQWNFLFLTKFPIRMAEFEFPANAWVGTTVDRQYAVERAEKAFRQITAGVKFLSCEPMLEPLKFSSLDMFQWVILGGSSKSTQTPEFRPPREWVNDLESQARAAGCKIYEKPNLLERIKEYPGS